MQIGSPAHKELFCRTFFEGHEKYEPADLPWPVLAEEPLALLRGLPFWTHARQFESDAGPLIRSVAALETDPLIREALELQAYEEERHARLVDHMIGLYELPAEENHVEMNPDPLTEFMQFGFEECLDSFGAFGLFKLARESQIVPHEIFKIFENVMREESHHIVFFVNWYAHRETNRGTAARLLRTPRAIGYYARALRMIAELVRSDDTEEGADFIVTGAQAFVDNLTPQLVVQSCLAENERRLAGFDRRLLVPQLVPRLARLAGAVMKLAPKRSVGDARASSGLGTRPPEQSRRSP